MGGSIMNELDEYQSNALRTAIYPLERDLEYTTLGLLSEIGELAEVYIDANYGKGAGRDWGALTAEALSETGDCYWYTAAIADAMGTTLGEIADTNLDSTIYLSGSRGMLIVFLQREAGAIAGIVKKAIRDNGGTLTAVKQVELEKRLLNVLALLDHFSTVLGSSRKAVMNKNLNKLADRKTRGTLEGSGNNR